MDNENQKQLPAFSIRVGAVNASCWKNQIEVNGQKIDVYNTQIDRSYKDKEGNWKKTGSYKLNDLPKVILAANKCFEYIATLKKESEQ